MGLWLLAGTMLYLYISSTVAAFLLFGWIGGVAAVAFLVYVTAQLLSTVSGLLSIIPKMR
jgi:hypothetical protein